jgi:hypothetical protein
MYIKKLVGIVDADKVVLMVKLAKASCTQTSVGTDLLYEMTLIAVSLM